MAVAIELKNVRLSFPKLIEAVAPQGTPGAAKKFGADFLMPPNHPGYAKIMEEVGRVAAEKWKDKAVGVLQMIQPDRRMRCYGQGNEKVNKKTMQPYDGYADMMYLGVSADEAHPPSMVDANSNIIPNSNMITRQDLAHKMYGGCYVNAAVSLWAQDNQFGRAIRCQLIAIQFAADGKPFGEAAPDVSGMFGVVAPPDTGAAKMPWEM